MLWYILFLIAVVAACTCSIIETGKDLKTSENNVSGDNQQSSTTNDQPMSLPVHYLLRSVGRNLTTEAVSNTTTKVKMIGAGFIAFFSSILLLILPMFCYIMKYHRKPKLDPETPPVDPAEGDDEATRNDQGLEDQCVGDIGLSLDITTIANVVCPTSHTTLGVTDAMLNRSTAFTMRDRIVLHNISRKLKTIIDRIDETELRPNLQAVRVKSVEKVNCDDEETDYGASWQSITLKTLNRIATDHARDSKKSDYGLTAEKGSHKMDIKPRKRLSLPRFDETSPNLYYDITGGHAMTTPNNNDSGYLTPIRVASTSPDVSPLLVRRREILQNLAAIKDDAYWISKIPDD